MMSNQLSAAVRGANLSAYGHKGGEQQPKPPVESPDTISNRAFAQLVDLISEGEIVGLVNGARSIYLDETPAQSESVLNFGGFDWQQRTGSLYQEHISGYPNAESETGVNFELKASQPFTRAINKLELSAVRVRVSIARLLSTDAKGNTNGATVSWKFEVQTDGGPFVEASVQTVTAKASNKYARSTRINLPTAKVGWTLRVTRLTPDSTSQTLVNPTLIEAITEIIDRKFAYPNRALIATQFDAQSFSGIPKRTFHIKGRIIRVPSNYDAEYRVYSGVWDGTFKPAYTNNPAWVYYDLLLHKRYGLGNNITAAQVDKWELYRIAQYCDQLVDDGKGGKEPRFTCNVYLQEQAAALRVMQDLASIFRGISYWGAGQTYVSADMPSDIDHTFTNASVIDGMFNYRGAPLDTRYNVAVVSWNDPADFYRAKAEYVQDRAGITSFGSINKMEMVAFGCSSQGQAQRAGKWAILTNTLESEIVTFSVPLSGCYVKPGDTFRIADNDLAGRSIGGRILSSAGRSVVTDREVVAHTGDTAIFMVGGEPVTMTIAAYDTATRTLTMNADFPAGKSPSRMDPWVIESKELALTEWRVASVSENESASGGVIYEISATKHNRSKFNAIEFGTAIEKPPITVIPPSVQQPPVNISVTSNWAIDQTMAVTTMTITWDQTPNATRYEVQWRMNDRDWIYAGPAYGTEMDVEGIFAGAYTVRVQAVNAMGVHSHWTTSETTQLQGKTGAPPKVAYLKAAGLTFGIGLEWGFLPGSSDTLRTEIQYATGPNEALAIKLGDFAYPINTHTMMGLAAGVRFYFRARLVDRTGNIGDWSEWETGMSSNQASDVLTYLKGQITQTELGAELAAEIPKISGSGPGSVNVRIKDAQDAVNVQINNINAQLAELAGSDEWKADRNYVVNDIVKHEGGLWRAKVNNIGSEPPSDKWEKIGDYADVAEALAAMAVQLNNVQTSVNRIDGDLVALTTEYEGIFAQVNPPMAGSMGDFAGAITVMAGVWSEKSARASTDSALGIRIDGLVARVGDNEATIIRNQQVMASRVEAVASDVSAMTTRVDGNTAGLVNEANLRATEDYALSQRIELQGAYIDSANAAIKAESIARADETGALARRTTTLETTVGNHTSSIEQNTSLVNKLNGDLSLSWSVKMQANNLGGQNWAGFGLGIDGSSGQLESRFFIAADQFYITSSLAGGYTDVPFAIINGQTFIRSAFIQDSSITMLKIGNNLQSDDYLAQTRGWIMPKTGAWEMNGSDGNGRMKISNTGIFFYHPNGVVGIELSL